MIERRQLTILDALTKQPVTDSGIQPDLIMVELSAPTYSAWLDLKTIKGKKYWYVRLKAPLAERMITRSRYLGANWQGTLMEAIALKFPEFQNHITNNSTAYR